jgi:hypothetical protein
MYITLLHNIFEAIFLFYVKINYILLKLKNTFFFYFTGVSDLGEDTLDAFRA